MQSAKPVTKKQSHYLVHNFSVTLDEISNDSHGVIKTERAKFSKVTEKEILMSESEADDSVNF
jgi:hypothetical protein